MTQRIERIEVKSARIRLVDRGCLSGCDGQQRKRNTPPSSCWSTILIIIVSIFARGVQGFEDGRCFDHFAQADLDNDNELDSSEYLMAVNTLSGGLFQDVQNFNKLPLKLQDLFYEIAHSCNNAALCDEEKFRDQARITIYGTKLGQTRTEYQEKYLQAACWKTYTQIDAYTISCGSSPRVAPARQMIPVVNRNLQETPTKVQCLVGILLSDRDRDSKIDNNEYVKFIDQLSDSYWGDDGAISFDDLPYLLRENFLNLAGSGNDATINVYGARSSDYPENEQEQYLEKVCGDTSLSINAAMSSAGQLTESPSATPTQVGGPTTSRPTFPSLPLPRCFASTVIADRKPKDGFIGSIEYVTFIDILSRRVLAFDSYDDLPPILKVNFITLATNNQINILGSRPGDNPTLEQEEYLERVCRDSYLAIIRYLDPVPTISPSSMPSAIPSTLPPTPEPTMQQPDPSPSTTPSSSGNTLVPSSSPSVEETITPSIAPVERTAAPSISSSPSVFPSGRPSVTPPIITLAPSKSSVPSVSPTASPVFLTTLSPSLSPNLSESMTPTKERFTGIVEIESNILVSNAEDLTVEKLLLFPKILLNFGHAYRQTASNVTGNFIDSQKNRLLRIRQGSRRLTVAFLNSTIDILTDVECPENLSKQFMCQHVLASFRVDVTNEDQEEDFLINQLTGRMNAAIKDGTLQEKLREINPDHRFTVQGVIPTGQTTPTPTPASNSPNNGLSGGAIAGIVIALVVVLGAGGFYMGAGGFYLYHRRKIQNQGQLLVDSSTDDDNGRNAPTMIDIVESQHDPFVPFVPFSGLESESDDDTDTQDEQRSENGAFVDEAASNGRKQIVPELKSTTQGDHSVDEMFSVEDENHSATDYRDYHFDDHSVSDLERAQKMAGRQTSQEELQQQRQLSGVDPNAYDSDSTSDRSGWSTDDVNSTPDKISTPETDDVESCDYGSSVLNDAAIVRRAPKAVAVDKLAAYDANPFGMDSDSEESTSPNLGVTSRGVVAGTTTPGVAAIAAPRRKYSDDDKIALTNPFDSDDESAGPNAETGSRRSGSPNDRVIIGGVATGTNAPGLEAAAGTRRKNSDDEGDDATSEIGGFVSSSPHKKRYPNTITDTADTNGVGSESDSDSFTTSSDSSYSSIHERGYDDITQDEEGSKPDAGIVAAVIASKKYSDSDTKADAGIKRAMVNSAGLPTPYVKQGDSDRSDEISFMEGSLTDNSTIESSMVDDSTEEAEKRAEYRSEVEILVREVVPDEIDNVDVMMVQFRGREVELVATLRTMRERSVTQRARAAVHKSSKRPVRRLSRGPGSWRGNSPAVSALISVSSDSSVHSRGSVAGSAAIAAASVPKTATRRPLVHMPPVHMPPKPGIEQETPKSFEDPSLDSHFSEPVLLEDIQLRVISKSDSGSGSDESEGESSDSDYVPRKNYSGSSPEKGSGSEGESSDSNYELRRSPSSDSSETDNDSSSSSESADGESPGVSSRGRAPAREQGLDGVKGGTRVSHSRSSLSQHTTSGNSFDTGSIGLEDLPSRWRR